MSGTLSEMKATKRKKSLPDTVTEHAAVPVNSSEPDAAYVEELLSAASVADLDAVAVAEPDAPDQPLATAVITLPSQCLLRDATEFQHSLLSYSSLPEVCIEADAVERIDTAFIQVLLAFVHSRDSCQVVRWSSVSPALGEAAATLGLQALLAMPELVAAA